MLGISDVAESIGFRTIGLRTSLQQLVDNVQLPCILHWNQNHFVVCYDIKKNRRTGRLKFCIADPASQRVTYDEAQFVKCWYSTSTDECK